MLGGIEAFSELGTLGVRPRGFRHVYASLLCGTRGAEAGDRGGDLGEQFDNRDGAGSNTSCLKTAQEAEQSAQGRGPGLLCFG